MSFVPAWVSCQWVHRVTGTNLSNPIRSIEFR